MLCNVSLQILPSVPDECLYQVVDKVIEMIQESGVKYVVGPMETTMEVLFLFPMIDILLKGWPIGSLSYIFHHW